MIGKGLDWKFVKDDPNDSIPLVLTYGIEENTVCTIVKHSQVCSTYIEAVVAVTKEDKGSIEPDLR